MRRLLAVAAAAAILAAVPQAVYAADHSVGAVQQQENSGKPYSFGFYKSKNGQLPSIAREGFMDMLKRHNAVFLGNTEEKELYLTFDNGYENGFTPGILDVLKDKQVPAAFFVTGHYIKDQPELIRRMASEGHTVGNHSWSHPDMTTLEPARIAEELEKVRSGVEALTGQKDMKYLRPPRGVFSERVLKECAAQGYTSVFWSIAYKDWEPDKQKGADYAYARVMEQLHPGAVLLLHSVSQDNAQALGRIIDEARTRGYSFKPLDQLTVRTYR